MGIYPQPPEITNRQAKDGVETWTETYKPGDGSVRVSTVTRVVESLTWETCYCCSCGEYGADPACRNHGFAAVRPCEVHKTAGAEWGDEIGEGDPDIGKMPASVQEERKRRDG